MTEPDAERGAAPGSPHQAADDVIDPGAVPDTVTYDRESLHPRSTPPGGLRSDAEGPPTSPRGIPVSVRPVRAPITVVRRTLGSTAALRASLAAKEAEANELRDSIDELKRQLTIERSADPPERRQGFPGWALALILLALVLALLGLLSYCTRSGGGAISSPTPSTAPSTAPTAASTTGPSRSASPAPVTQTVAAGSPVAAGATVSTTPMPWAGRTLLTPDGLVGSGPGVDAAGSAVTYALDADGTSVDVYERLRPVTPGAQIVAQLPAVAGSGLVGELGATRPGVAGLQVELDGQAVTPRQSGPGAWTAAKPDGTAITSAVLRYRLTDAVIRIQPARNGRLAALLTPLTGTDAKRPVQLQVLGRGLISLSCPLAHGGAALCGNTTSSSASGTVPTGTPAIAQLQFDRV